MTAKRVAAFGFIALLAVGAVASPAGASTVVLRSTLSGTRSVPFPGNPNGTGGIFMIINDDTNRVCTLVWVRDIATPTGAHIHFGAEGEVGGHAIDLNTPTYGASFTCLVASKALVEQLISEPETFYANIHNAEYPDGALRGQLQPVV